MVYDLKWNVKAVLINSENTLTVNCVFKFFFLGQKYVNTKIKIMEDDLFTPRVFTKIIEIFVRLGKKWAFLPPFYEFGNVKRNDSFQASNINSRFLNSATESGFDHILTLYVYIF